MPKHLKRPSMVGRKMRMPISIQNHRIVAEDCLVQICSHQNHDTATGGSRTPCRTPTDTDPIASLSQDSHQQLKRVAKNDDRYWDPMACGYYRPRHDGLPVGGCPRTSVGGKVPLHQSNPIDHFVNAIGSHRRRCLVQSSKARRPSSMEAGEGIIWTRTNLPFSYRVVFRTRTA